MVGESSVGGKLRSFGTVTSTAFALVGILLVVITLSGVETFGTAAQPFILNNYASKDVLAVFARAGLLLCVLFEFPLLERCFRVTTGALLGLEPSTSAQPAAVLASVALATGVACIPNLGLDQVNALAGSLGASLLIYIGPSLMALSVRESRPAARGTYVSFGTLPTLILRGMLIVGIFLGLLGAAAAFSQ